MAKRFHPLYPLLPLFATRPPHGAVALSIMRPVATFLPMTLVRLWRESGRGLFIFDEGLQAEFKLGAFFWRDVQADTAIYLPPDCEDEVLWEMVGMWLNHFGGSFGKGQRISEGYGATPTLEQAAKRFIEAVALGYATDYFNTKETTLLFARAVVAYRLFPRALSAADPILWRWLRGSLFNEGFWRQVAREIQP